MHDRLCCLRAAAFRPLLAALTHCLWFAVATAAAAEPAPLIPRRALLRESERSAPAFDPTGRSIAWLQPTNGILNVWVRSVATNDTRMVSRDPRGSVRQPLWQADGSAVLFLQDADGFGSLHLMQAHLGSGVVRDLTPFPGISARLAALSPRRVGEIFATFPLRDSALPDLYRINLRSGLISLAAENDGRTTAWIADDDLNVRLIQHGTTNGEQVLTFRSDPRSMWRPVLQWGLEDAQTRVVGFGPEATNAYLVSSLRAPAARLLSLDLARGTTVALAQDPRYDLATVVLDPLGHGVDALQFTRSRAQWQVINTNLVPDFEALRRLAGAGADFDLLGRDAADRRWLVRLVSAQAPPQYGIFERAERKWVPMYGDQPWLEGARLARVRAVSFKARDGLPLEGYLTLPDGLEPQRLPLIVLAHGGPWTRVEWGFDPEAQWLANRGYAVLQINFRGSTGFGRPHLDAGDKEWGGKIVLDLIDARKWAIDEGIADERKTAIVGTGYGGFAALAALTLHPGVFAAGASLGGPLLLPTVIHAVPESAPALRAMLERRLGHPEKDKELMVAQSPGLHADQLKSAMLVAIPGRDPQIPVTEMDRFVTAARQQRDDVEYLYFADEGTVLRDPANRLRYAAALEGFLGKYLGGRVEPPADIEQFGPLRR